MSVIRDWAAWAATASGAACAPPLALHLADGVLAWRAGRQTPEGHRLRAWHAAADSGAPGQAALCAALLRHSEMDDIHRASGITPTAIALPALLPWIAGRSPREVRDAFFAGLELSVAAGLSIGGTALFAKGQWPTLAVAPLGAAAALGRLLGLDAPRMAQALALASLQSMRTPGRSTGEQPARWLLFGQAVRAGCVAALAAAEGVEADVEAASNALAVQAVHLPDASCPAIAQTSLKPYPAAKQVLAALTALQRLVPEGSDPAAIRRIEVFVPAAYAAMLQREPPAASRLARLVHGPWQLALQCCAPQALGDAARRPLDPDVAQQVEALAARIMVTHDPALDTAYPARWPARVVVDDGTPVREALVTDSDGDPGTGIDAGWLRRKAIRLLEDPAERERVLACLAEELPPAVVADLATLAGNG